MSPTPFHAKQEQHDNGGTYDHRTPPKINKDSTFNHRLPPPPPPPPPSSSSTTPTNSDNLTTKPQPQPPRRPVIIYTHSPKVIHTHPRDFMALVQKLTGYTPPPDETQTQHPDPRHQRGQGGNTEDNESTSVVTEEHGSSVNDIGGGGPQVNSCFADGGVTMAPPPYKAAGFDPYFNPTTPGGFPVNPTDYLCPHGHQLQFYNPESMFMNRNSSRVLREYPDI